MSTLLHRASSFNRFLACYDEPLIHSSPRPNIKTGIYVTFSVWFASSMGVMCGPGSSVGIATDYGLEGPGSNPGGDENFRQSRLALGPTQPPIQWVSGLSRW